MAEINVFSEHWRINAPGLTDEQGARIAAAALGESKIYQQNRILLEQIGQDITERITRHVQEATARGGRMPVEAPQALGLHLEPPEPEPMTVDLKIEALPQRNAFNVFINGQKVMPGKGA